MSRVLVTGAASGIGRAAAERLLAAGHSVWLADLDQEAVETVAVALAREGRDVGAGDVDVTDPSSCSAAVASMVDRWGGLDALVHCAGVLAGGTVGDTSPEEWERVFNVNVFGTYAICHAVIPAMADGGGGAIVTMASAAGVAPMPALAAYGASKAAVVMLTKCIALDYGSVGIGANCVCPGVVDTPMVRAGADDEAHQAAMADEATRHVLGRVGTPDEVAALIAHLVSDDNAFMTGSAVVLDGGFSLAPARWV